MKKSSLNVQGLEVQDLVRVRYPHELSKLVAEADIAWQEFCLLPMPEKNRYPYQIDASVSGVGYQSTSTTGDPKEHFHIRLSQSAWLLTEAEKTHNPVIIEFVDTALRLAEGLKPFARQFVESAEEEFELPALAKDIMAVCDEWTPRFLHYFAGAREGDEFAMQHTDKGCLTLHLHESHSGFEHLTREGLWQPIAFGKDETLVIAGLRLQYRSSCRLTAVCHRVVASEETARVGRNSIVCFFDCKNIPYYDKKRHGSTQNFPPGFNYGMPFETYKTLFMTA